MARWSRPKVPIDSYDDLMARRSALEREVHRRIKEHQGRALKQLPLDSGPARAVRASTEGIRLAANGSLDVVINFQDAYGVQSTLVLRADEDGGIEEVRPYQPQTEPESATHAKDETEERLRVVTALAHQHLPDGAAAEFLALLRPALRLVRAGEEDPVVAQLGGLPTLPINTWPVWQGHGPLHHVLSFDCAPVAAMLPDQGLPSEGRLAFFYFDGSYDNFESIVGSWDPSTRPGFRVLHLHPELSTRADLTDAATPAPPGLAPFPTVRLTAIRTLTWPAHETPLADILWTRHGVAGPVVSAFYDALWELPGAGYDTHQIGGHPCPQQGPVELEIEQLRWGMSGEPFDWTDPDVLAAARGWRLLLQVASDDAAEMMWGDVGQLYFLTRDGADPEDALFTWQCG